MSYITGIDVSNNNGNIDFSYMANDDVQYVYVKATEGSTFKDSYMDNFYNDCKSYGLKIGAYHFLVSTSTPEAQARNFYEKIKDYTWDLIPMMDVETNFDDLSDYVERFIAAFKQLCNLELGIYSYTSFISNLQGAQNLIKDMKFWEANYNNDPWNLADTFFTNRIGHQYTESASISGVSGKCDKNSFTEGVLLDNSTMSDRWISKDGKWYYLSGSDKTVKTGWQKIDEKWYFLDTSGVMQTGWIIDNSKNYYLTDSGDMLCNCNEMGYNFDNHGVATKPSFISIILNFIASILKAIHK